MNSLLVNGSVREASCEYIDTGHESLTAASNEYTSENVDRFSHFGTNEQQCEDDTRQVERLESMNSSLKTTRDRQSVWNRWRNKRNTTLRRFETRPLKHYFDKREQQLRDNSRNQTDKSSV